MVVEKIIHSYSSPFNFGHKAIEDLFNGTVYVTEKIDGSQFSFSFLDGELLFRSRGQAVDPANPQMFALGVEAITNLAKNVELKENWTYRGEYLSTPKHNTIVYARTPKDYVILFDVDKGNQDYLDMVELKAEADRIGLECVPWLDTYTAKPTVEQLKSLLEIESILGGHKVEGVVLKNYAQYGRDKKVLMAKYVSDEFVETHKQDWKTRNPHQAMFLDELSSEYSTDARRQKALQHLREAGLLKGEVQDIPVLLREMSQDVLKDCEQEIKEKLFKFFWKQIAKGITRGIPEWYKNVLLEESLK